MHDTVQTTRERIRKAALELFGTSGVKTTTLDSIARRAGVTKRTLYYHYRSKDELVTEALEAAEPSNSAMAAMLNLTPGMEAEQAVKVLFGNLRQASSNQRWKGCAYMRAVVEFAGMPGHPAIAAAKRHRKSIELEFLRLLQHSGVNEPEKRAARLLLLVDGAIVQSILYHDAAHVDEAELFALDLIGTTPPTGVRGVSADASAGSLAGEIYNLACCIE